MKAAAGALATEVCCLPTADDAEPVAALDDEALAAAAKAAGHPARVRILRLLAERQACVTGDLVTELSLSQSTIYEHLRTLRQAGLIQGEIDGPRVSYCLDHAGLAAFKQAVAGL
jgi:ArsR family transcriptional regulator